MGAARAGGTAARKSGSPLGPPAPPRTARRTTAPQAPTRSDGNGSKPRASGARARRDAIPRPAAGVSRAIPRGERNAGRYPASRAAALSRAAEARRGVIPRRAAGVSRAIPRGELSRSPALCAPPLGGRGATTNGRGEN